MTTKTILSLEKRKRLPILRRAAPHELPRFRLTGRDRDIVYAVYQCRALTSQQIARLFFPNGKHHDGEVNARCKHRLRMLYHNGYLFRDEQPQKLSEGRKPFVYFLDVMGAEYLSKQLGSEIDFDPNENDVSYPFLDHRLAANQVRILISLAAKNHSYEILTWLDDKVLKSPQMKDNVTIKGKQGGKERAAVVPDAYFRLDAKEDVYNFFVEVDRGTVTGEATEWGKRDWARKVKSYLEYYRSGKYEKRYRTSDMRVLTITTSEKRLANLKAITEDAGGKARFWFSTFDRIEQQDVLTSPIWGVASKENLHALFKP